MAKKLELAWAAGFYDGEGCCTFHSSGRLARICISQNDTEVLERFQSAVGLGKIYGPYGPYKGRSSKARYDWVVHRVDEVVKVADLLWPFLSSTKQDQFNRILGRWNDSH